jgi:hypothetical protein
LIKNFLFGALCAAATIAAVSPADAAGHCGLKYHRDPYGRCRLNLNGALIESTPRGNIQVGVFYPGRGYWDGNRYWWHRDAWHGGWRYR